MNKLLTIIVPTYNMEDYLDKCLTSLIVGKADSESMQQLEVLVVNDGSTDSSSAIAHGYEARYPYTFKVIDKDNGNYGSCINTALPIATGKYVKILDADDWFDTDVLSKFLGFLKTTDVDMVLSDFEKVNPEDKHRYTSKLNLPPSRILSVADYSLAKAEFKMHHVTYRSSIFEGLDYHQTEGIYYTDFEWIFLPASRVKTIFYFPYPLYLYLRGRNGQSMDPVIRNRCIEMRVKVMFSALELYQLCLLEGGNRNGISLNMDYLHSICISRVILIYRHMFARQKESEVIKLYKQTEQRIRLEYPDFYKEMNSFVFPLDTYTPPYVSFHMIRSWRRYGKTLTSIQLWFINHCNGILYRIYLTRISLICRIC